MGIFFSGGFMKKGLIIFLSVMMVIAFIPSCRNYQYPYWWPEYPPFGDHTSKNPPSDIDTAMAIDLEQFIDDVLNKRQGLIVKFYDSTASSSSIRALPEQKSFYADVTFDGYTNGIDRSVLNEISSGKVTVTFTYLESNGNEIEITGYSIETKTRLVIECDDSANTLKNAEIEITSGGISATASASVSPDGSVTMINVTIVSFTTPSGTITIGSTTMATETLVPESYGSNLGFDGGAGTETDPIPINNEDDLILLADLVNDKANPNSFEGKYFRLSTDLELNDWSPIGQGLRSSSVITGSPFSGVFDGGGHTITVNSFAVLETADNDDKTPGVGIFGFLSGENAEIRNLRVSGNVDFKGTAAQADNLGMIVGLLNGGATIDRCVIAEGSSIKAEGLAGGIVGRIILAGTITNCENNANVTTVSDKAAGIVASAYYNQDPSLPVSIFLEHNTNNGNITGPYYTGGIAGLVQGARINDCHNTGTISAYRVVGGIAGSAEFRNEMADCSNSGSIVIRQGEGQSPNSAGGIAGQIVKAGNATFSGLANSNENTFSFDEAFAPNAPFRYFGGIVGQVTGDADVSGTNASDIKGPEESTDFEYAGGIAGYFSGDGKGTLTGINSGDISGAMRIGGIVGSLSNGTVASAVNNAGTTITGSRFVGGIAGSLTSSNGGESSIKDSDNSGSIFVLDSNEYNYAGGIAGYAYVATVEDEGTGELVSTDGSVSISGSDNLAEASFTIQDTSAIFVGGITGRLYGEGSISDCNNSADIKAEVTSNSQYFGGIVGGIRPIGITGTAVNTIENCDNSGEISAQQIVGGITGSAISTDIQNCNNKGALSAHLYIGGIAGSIRDGSSIDSCDNTAGITASCDGTLSDSSYGCARYVGGITGYVGYTGDVDHELNKIDACSIINSDCSGTINTSGTLNYIQVGGIAGTIINAGLFESCEFSGEITGNAENPHGIAGTVYLTEANYEKVEDLLSFTNCIVTGSSLDTGIPQDLN